jgi:hypothetical protein
MDDPHILQRLDCIERDLAAIECAKPWPMEYNRSEPLRQALVKMALGMTLARRALAGTWSLEG